MSESDAPVTNSRASPDRCRTVVVGGVPDVLPGSRMRDKLTVYFQSKKSRGGDVEEVQFPTRLRGVAFVTFENRRDADRVVEFDQVLKDKEFTEEFPLTVYHYTPEVALYAFAEVDLSLYPDLSTSIESLRSSHRSVRIQPSLTKPGYVSVEGPFSALQELREDLLSRAQNLGDVLDEASGLDKPEPSVRDDTNGTGGTNGVRLWLDTHIYKYMQTVERKEWDRCLGRYEVTAQAVITGEVTEVELRGKCDETVLTDAEAELQKLVAERQGTLRTQNIDCGGADLATWERLLQECDLVQRIYTDVCYVPADSCVEVIGPSFSIHRFCELVKIGTERSLTEGQYSYFTS